MARFSDLMKHIKPVELGQHHIQNHQIMRTCKHRSQPALTIIDVTAHWITNPALAFGGTALGCAFRVGLVIRAART